MYNYSVSNQFASNLILEEFKLKVLQENLTKIQATTQFYTLTFVKIQILISLLNTSLLILRASFLFGPVPPFHLYITNIRTLLLALRHCDGHKEMHSSVSPLFSSLNGKAVGFCCCYLFSLLFF